MSEGRTNRALAGLRSFKQYEAPKANYSSKDYWIGVDVGIEEDKPCEEVCVGNYAEDTPLNDFNTDRMQGQWFQEPNYESFSDCLRFWQDRGYIFACQDDENLKCVVYNLCAVKKYCRENNISHHYRGLPIDDVIFVIVAQVSKIASIRIKDAEKFFKFAVEFYADTYYYLSEHNNGYVTRTMSGMKTINAITEILKNEEDHGV